MRPIVLLLFFVACGCSTRVIDTEVSDSAGTNRLLLVKVVTQSANEYLSNSASYDFDSLKWQTKVGRGWRDHVVIRCSDFQGTSSRTRWVSAIQSIDPTKGTAVIKVAEGDVPAGSPTIHYAYSWREWNLVSNNEVRTIRICKDSSEKY